MAVEHIDVTWERRVQEAACLLSAAARLTKGRRESGWSVRETARKLGISVATLGRIERGQFPPRLKVAARIQDVFGIPMREWLP